MRVHIIASAILVLLISTSVLMLTVGTDKDQADPYRDSAVNAVLGDESFHSAFDVTPHQVEYQKRISTHLHYVIDKLSSKESRFTGQQHENRVALLEELRSYTEAGEFPKNEHYEHPRPRFMDPYGNICAVGHLIAETEGLELVKEINENYEYDYLLDMEDERIADWAENHGFTKKELAMIQPAYDWDQPDDTEPYSKPMEVSVLALNSGLAAVNTYHMFSRHESALMAGTSVALGTGTLLMGRSDRANYRTADYVMGATSVAIGAIGVIDWASQQFGSNDEPAISGRLNSAWRVDIGPEPGFAESATLRVGYSF